MMTGRLLTAVDVAALLAVPTSWVYRAAREGAIPSVRLGRYVRFDEADISEWVASRRESGTS